jgi:hypothetical protein
MAGLLTKAPPPQVRPNVRKGGAGMQDFRIAFNMNNWRPTYAKPHFIVFFFIGSRTVRSFIISGSIILRVQEHYR